MTSSPTALFSLSTHRYQDTVESEKGAQLFAKSYISGNTDFIFGRTGLAWFSACDIRVVAGTLGYVTASGIQTAGSKSIFVIDHSTVAAKTGDSVPNGAYYLVCFFPFFLTFLLEYTNFDTIKTGPTLGSLRSRGIPIDHHVRGDQPGGLVAMERGRCADGHGEFWRVCQFRSGESRHPSEFLS